MNTHAEYRRHLRQPDPSHHQSPEADAVSHLATHRDPSLVGPETATAEMTTLNGRRIVWIRPTEAHTLAAPLLGRGVDLHAELVRRLRSSPVAAAHAVRRSIPTARMPGGTTPTTWEGPSL